MFPILPMVLVCLSVAVDGAVVVPWTVCSMEPGISFTQLFKKLQAGSIDFFQPYAGKLQQCLKAASRNPKKLRSVLLTSSYLSMKCVVSLDRT